MLVKGATGLTAIKCEWKHKHNVCHVECRVPSGSTVYTLVVKNVPRLCKEHTCVDTFRAELNSQHLRGDTLKCISWKGNFWALVDIFLKFVHKCLINNKLALLQVMAWCWTGDKPLQASKFRIECTCPSGKWIVKITCPNVPFTCLKYIKPMQLMWKSEIRSRESDKSCRYSTCPTVIFTHLRRSDEWNFEPCIAWTIEDAICWGLYASSSISELTHWGDNMSWGMNHHSCHVIGFIGGFGFN